jgi:hypothetical protein
MQVGGKSPYPTPQSVLRRALGTEEYKFASETVTSDHIRAAVIMPLEVPFQHLLECAPWGMSYTTPEWRMIIVSVLDPIKWLDLARASGAKAWLKGHNMTVTYNWEPPPMDEHGLKKRPPNAQGVTRVPEPGIRKDKGQQRKAYDKESVIEDLRLGLFHQDIAVKHGISRITVIKIAQQNGLSKGKTYV